jgi:purine-binding chemotaxis protein CheW
VSTAVVPTPQVAPAGRRALLLPLHSDWYAVPLELVEQVLEPGRLTALPGAPAAALGVLNVRGRVVPVLDLGRLLGLEPVGRIAAVAVVGTSRGPAGLALGGIPTSEALANDLGPSSLVAGVARHRVGAGVATLLDLEAMLAPERLV